jgi:hypothetical protein
VRHRGRSKRDPIRGLSSDSGHGGNVESPSYDGELLNSSSRALASFRSAVSKPSVNQL